MVKKQNWVICLDNTYKDIAQDVETRFDTSNYGLDHHLNEKIKSNWINER